MKVSGSPFQSAPTLSHLTPWVTFNLLLVSNYGCWQILLARRYPMEQGFPHNWRADEAQWGTAWPVQGVTWLKLSHQAWKRPVLISMADVNEINITILILFFLSDVHYNISIQWTVFHSFVLHHTSLQTCEAKTHFGLWLHCTWNHLDDITATM